MISKLDINNHDLVNELVNFIFVKQNNKNFSFNTFPKDFNGIRYFIKKYDVLYIKEADIKLIMVYDTKEVQYLYFKDILYLKQNVTYLKGRKLIINKENILTNELINMNIYNNNKNHYQATFNLKLDINNKVLKQQLNKKYIVIPLLKHLANEYLSIHSENHYQNHDTIVCIKNNEMIGYLDFEDGEILEICSISKNEDIYKQTVEQLLLNYLINAKVNKVVYQTDDLKTYNILKELGFTITEENLNMEITL